ncbi:alpha/beta hydrolase [Luedemannella helvata]|uniref:Alpha/beta hydrolase n=1 Tax=Luedemannella helvata TaxID=349315 RepID=A0ABN2KXR1_9ACTN
MPTDILGEPYEQLPIELDADDEGDVVATLVRRRAPQPTGRAVLYLHGYVDYFFQTHLADFYIERGWDFYALDLRKYGRSLLAHQTPNFTRSLSEYFPELDAAVHLIRETDGHDTVVLNGHSTGGLIAALWAHRVRGTGLVQAMFLNSPFFDFNVPWVTRRLAGPAIERVGAVRPYRLIPQNVTMTYGRSLHIEHDGEWEYNLAWKPVESFPVRAGWVRAIRDAHRRLHAGLAVDVPVLVGCSTASFRGPFAEAAHHADVVLDVEHIARWSPYVGRHVTLVRFEGAKHDLLLSRQPVRERVLDELDRWLTAYLAKRALAPVRESQVGLPGTTGSGGV